MNQFNATLKQARSKQLRLYLVSALGGLTIILMVLFILLMTNGVGFEIGPKDARERAELSVKSGIAFALGHSVYTVTGIPVVEVTSPGFAPAERSINSEERGTQIKVTMQPLPGTLRATTGHGLEETRWIIDGSMAELASVIEIERPAGEYTLRSEHRFFNAFETTVELQRGEVTDISISPDRILGTLDVNSTPSGAQVFLDNEPKGNSPLVLELSGDRYNLRLEKPGFEILEETVEITNQDPLLSRDYQLKRLTADIIVRAKPEGGQLLVNGTTAMIGVAITVPSGEPVSISYFKDGYQEVVQTVLLDPGEQAEIDLALKAELMSVVFESEPTSDVFVAGRKIGRTPVSKTLLAIPQKVEFRKPGYRTVRETLKPAPGSESIVSVRLLPELAARRQEIPLEYQNAAGLMMKRFEPSTITMGAPRSERGQRANEFIRTVELTKTFYASTTEVTNASYRKFKPGHGPGAADGRPVTAVTWLDAVKFCNWLSAKEGLRPFYLFRGQNYQGFDRTADGYRLLSEAEWEWLARRAGKERQTKFTWGDGSIIPKSAGNVADETAKGQVKFYVENYQDGHAGLAPSGKYPAEQSGLYDQFGNVSEWTHDVYVLSPPQTGVIERDRLGPDIGQSHVVKGANWRSGRLGELRPAYRQGMSGAHDHVGFRIARYLYGGE